GSIHADAEDAEARLRASAKDLEEHRFVVRHLLERLAPLCASVEMPATPAIKRLPNVLHLHTPVRAVLHEGVHACALVEALHPTPAVCGTPSTAASAWIAENEPGRGWYGGVVGWIDASGDAELIVALRCGVVRGASAWLWAGGGIVEGSEPEAEWIETQSKLRPVLEALGGET
ncbi:MAG: chorismate-binding protein, partial [Sandaracinaceae bacterium]|nr:chorismate-binding protein [Sandaracinaceae bacterium]